MLSKKGYELFVNDHRRDDSEASLIFAKTAGGLGRMMGGHGYSSDWSLVSDQQADVSIWPA